MGLSNPWECEAVIAGPGLVPGLLEVAAGKWEPAKEESAEKRSVAERGRTEELRVATTQHEHVLFIHYPFQERDAQLPPVLAEVREEQEKKMKVLCLHGFRTSGSFLCKQISKWDPSIFQHFQLEFPDGIFPAGGKSEIEGIFPPPYFEWFQFNKEFTEYQNLEQCISYLCDYITKNGPFHGLLGFSQGAVLAALLTSYQAQGKILKEHPPIKFVVLISGSKFRNPSISDIAYKDLIKVKSVHFIGEKDWLKLPSEELAAAFDNPLILRHPQGHTVPRLDEAAVKQLSEWIASEPPMTNPKNVDCEVNNIKQEAIVDPECIEASSAA
ncbi:hypothetical protein Cni_G15529 [Canna indica]|uniref:Serine hydrolase domain-containing protein n=1 Tax=Canna indica TaxID=4628 RepID=A0AAQ3QFU7_9LILI|nr:hypothetical protein Cni_G15529 [Canna indica]